MAKKKFSEDSGEKATVELLKDLLIVELGKASVPQLEIRKIVGCDIHRVSRIVRHFEEGLGEAVTDGEAATRPPAVDEVG